MIKGNKTRLTLGVIGIFLALPFLMWVPLGFLSFVPSIVDVFGIAGIRIPAGICIGGLLLAAASFYEW